jgi:flagellar protein FlaG
MIKDVTSLLPSPFKSALEAVPSNNATAVKTQAATGNGQTLPPAAPAPAAGNTNLDQKVKQLNQYAQSINRAVLFSIDQESGRTLVKVIDINTNEVISQIPSKQILVLDQALRGGNGLVFNTKA